LRRTVGAVSIESQNMNPGCTIIGVVYAKPEKREELRIILHGFVGPTRAEAGCIEYHFHVDDLDPNRFMFYENWLSKGDLDAHLAMPYLAILRERADELLGRPIEIAFYTMESRYSK
jgi:quinol monooxygenase YgiN